MDVDGLTIQYGVLEISANETNSIPLKSITCHNYDSGNMYIYDVAILTVNKFTKKNPNKFDDHFTFYSSIPQFLTLTLYLQF